MKHPTFRNLAICAIFCVTFLWPNAQTKNADSSIGNINKQIDTIASVIKDIRKQASKTDSALGKVADNLQPLIEKKQDSVKAADTTLFNAWQYAKKHPETTIYKKACDTCPGSFTVIRIVVFIFLLYFLYKAITFFIHTALCRDESYFTDPADNQIKLRPEKQRPYSYSRLQMFWWTIIIVSCYGAFYAMFGNLLPLNPTCILLLGGGLAVQIFGKTIDNSQKETDQNKETGENLPARHQDLPTKGLLTDILSDENGISMHRLQSVAFNIIYGIGFIGFFVTSICCRQYPLIDYEGWQLTLLGISTAGYLGLKTTENGKTTEEDRRNAALDENAKSTTRLSANNTDAGQITPLRDQKNYL